MEERETPTLVTKYQVKVTSTYFSQEIEASDVPEAVDLAINEFYDESHRAEIESSHVYDEWLDCETCGAERVEDDHGCEDEAEDE
jgi:hypothetical protein